MNRRNFFSALVVLALGILACGGQSNVELLRFPTPTTNSPTPLVVVQEITSTPAPTQTPNVIVLTQTPNELGTFCVSALVAVHLRPSPSTENYPVQTIPNGTEVVDLGGRSGNWIFVELGTQRGWVNGDYLTDC